MASSAEARERAVLDLLRERYEGNGYSFFAYPPAQLVPNFMEGYRPDAIAMRDDDRIAIEVKQRSRQDAKQLARVAERFASHPNWKFVVVSDEVLPDFEALGISSPEAIEGQLTEAEQLVRAEHYRAAFVLGWAIIEALARALQRGGEMGSQSRSPREVAEILERNGYIGFEEGRRLRNLVNLRNATVHGDFGVNVDKSAVEDLLQIARHLGTELRTAA